MNHIKKIARLVSVLQVYSTSTQMKWFFVERRDESKAKQKRKSTRPSPQFIPLRASSKPPTTALQSDAVGPDSDSAAAASYAARAEKWPNQSRIGPGPARCRARFLGTHDAYIVHVTKRSS